MPLNKRWRNRENNNKIKPAMPFKQGMMKMFFLVFIPILMIITSAFIPTDDKVEFKSDPANKKVEVFIGGKFFTAFIYPDNMEKQSLFPILSASGKTITRGYPLAPRPYERTDHPHHVGLWFNFGDVNGLDFWNNSFAIKAADKPKYGTVKFRKIISQDAKTGELVVSADWVDHTGKVLLTEETTYKFWGRIICGSSKGSQN